MSKAAAGAMGKAAGAAGVSSKAAVEWSKNLSKVRQASWEAGRDMFGSMAEIDFDKANQFMKSFGDFFKQFGVLSEFMKPFMMLMDVLDAALIKEFTTEIIALNKWCASFIDDIQYWTSRKHWIEFIIEIKTDEPGGAEAGKGGFWSEAGRSWFDYLSSPQGGFFGGMSVPRSPSLPRRAPSLKDILEGKY